MLCTKIHNQISLIFLDEKWQSLEVHTYISKYFLIGKVNFDIKIAKKHVVKFYGVKTIQIWFQNLVYILVNTF